MHVSSVAVACTVRTMHCDSDARIFICTSSMSLVAPLSCLMFSRLLQGRVVINWSGSLEVSGESNL